MGRHSDLRKLFHLNYNQKQKETNAYVPVLACLLHFNSRGYLAQEVVLPTTVKMDLLTLFKKIMILPLQIYLELDQSLVILDFDKFTINTKSQRSYDKIFIFMCFLLNFM